MTTGQPLLHAFRRPHQDLSPLGKDPEPSQSCHPVPGGQGHAAHGVRKPTRPLHRGRQDEHSGLVTLRGDPIQQRRGVGGQHTRAGSGAGHHVVPPADDGNQIGL